MDEELKNGILNGLNFDQRAAVLHDHAKDGQLLILAGAGSGKTSVLTKRIQYRILSGVSPEKILALTFTAKAAAEMRERVQKIFPEAAVRLCTFHSLALFILKSKVTTAQGEIFAYQMLGFKKMPVPMESADKDFENKLSKIKYRSESIKRENLFDNCYGPQVLAKLNPLRDEVLQTGRIVFEDLIYQAINLLENYPEAQDYFRGQWQEILVDEYQDINPSQYRLVKNLLGGRRELFVVGDDDQAIYGFRGADIGNINRFRDDFKESSLIRLEWNYRSVPNVLKLANGIFKNKPVHLRKVLRAGNPNGSGGNPLYKENREPEVWISDNPIEEMAKIVSSMKELREGYDLQWNNFAILVRYNRQRLYYEEALRDYGIPVIEASVEGEDHSQENGVHIETVHGSKGLQYAVVYYAGLAEGLTPGDCQGSRRARNRQMDEERRLFYVGVTRAEAFLVLLYCKRRFWKGRLCRLKPSRFLPKKSTYRDFRMPLILYKIFKFAYVLLYMAWQIVKFPVIRIRMGRNLDPWVDSTVVHFSNFCMKILGVDLEIKNQAALAKVDWNRPVFVVGNHSSFADIPIVFLSIQRSIGFVAKKSLGNIPFLNFWMKHIGCVLIDRKKGGAAACVREAVARREKAPRVFIFPEGTRSKNGQIGPFKSGAFRFAYEGKGIVLPIVIKNSAAIWEARKDTRPLKVSAQILEPIDMVDLLKQNPDLDPKRDMAPMVRQMMVDAL
ncbi:MAG: UvrD-helicase domain-containing protein [Fibrobacter sp.]|nr:UvrD-helicase domain-containing protein [Fibrobacter sp.]